MSTHEFIKLFERITGGSKPTAAAVMQAANAAPAKGTKRALLMGLNYFKTSSELHGCHNDVIAAVAALKAAGYTEFVVMLDDPNDPQFKKSDCPTRANILREMKAIISKCKAGDSCVIWYSGHGGNLADDRTGGDERDGRDETLVPCDYQLARADDKDGGQIRDDDLKKILVDGLPEGVKLRVVFDMCHSGSALDLPYSWISNTRTVQENNSIVNRDIVYLSGCMDDQTSADSFINGKASGALTWALLSTLSEIRLSGAKASRWTWKELTQECRSKLRSGRYDQIPVLGLSNKDLANASVDLI